VRDEAFTRFGFSKRGADLDGHDGIYGEQCVPSQRCNRRHGTIKLGTMGKKADAASHHRQEGE
jgi:hypothetical protein